MVGGSREAAHAPKLDDRFISQVLEGRHVAIVNAGPSTREHE
jgi:hypothetical protein